MRKWCASNSTCYRCYKEACLQTARDENVPQEEKDANCEKCIEFAKTEGYVVRPKREKKDNKSAKTDATMTIT